MASFIQKTSMDVSHNSKPLFIKKSSRFRWLGLLLIVVLSSLLVMNLKQLYVSQDLGKSGNSEKIEKSLDGSSVVQSLKLPIL